MRTRTPVAITAAILVACTILPAAQAFASGYDTPILYTARHIGMGGTAIGYVNDPSAVFHNPAGLGHLTGGAVTLNVSPLFGQITGSPSADAISEKSETALIPMFMAAAGYNITDRLSFGVAVFPLGGGSGSYKYSKTSAGGTVTNTEDMTSLAFIEVSPALAYEFPFLGGKVRVGAAWRYTLTQFQRKVTNTDEGKDPVIFHDMDMTGTDLSGYRVGIQGTFGDLDIGMVYRSGFTVAMDEVDRTEKTTVNGLEARDVGFEFNLPPKLGVGAELQMTRSLRLAADMELLFNSFNKEQNFTGKAFVAGTQIDEFKRGDLVNYSRWDDGITMRLGGEYTVSEALMARLGYVYDSKSANTAYPSAFGTPPGPTQSFTGGVGYALSKSLSLSAAVAYRSGEAVVTKKMLPKPDGEMDLPGCPFCGKEGTYSISMVGAYFDCVMRF